MTFEEATIAEAEDALIEAIRRLGRFRTVQSIGRKDRPATISRPAVFVLFTGDKNAGTKPRPVFDTEFALLVVNSNLASSGQAAGDTYGLLDAVRDAVQGKTFGLAGMEPFEVESRSLADYAEGVIEYEIRVSARRYLPLPTEN